MQSPDPMYYSNLPTSFDVTPLITNLQQHLDLQEELEQVKRNSEIAPTGIGSGGSLKQFRDETNAIQRVKLIELDPYYHQHFQQVVEPQPQRLQQNQIMSEPIKTRLLLAIAYGKNIVIGQLIALELRKVARDNNSDAKMEDMDDVEENNDCDELEWVDVSNARIQHPHLNRDGCRNIKTEERPETNVFVIFPISPRTDNDLPLDGCVINTTHNCEWKEVGLDNGAYLTGDITSCVLIPAPTISESQPRCKLQETPMNVETHLQHPRTVALMIGTACDQVLSLLLNVSVKSCSSSLSNDRNTTTSTSVLEDSNTNNESVDRDGDGVRFVLEYSECKIIEDGKLLRGRIDHQHDDTKGAPKDDTIPIMNPVVVQQILPSAKIFGLDNDAILRKRAQHATAMEDDDDHNSMHTNPNNSPIHVFHPIIASQSLSSNTTSSYDRDGLKPEGSVTYSGIKSITFSRRRTSNVFISGEIIEGDGAGDAIFNQDTIWITYGNGMIVQLPSWRPFLVFWTSSIADGNNDEVINSGPARNGDGSTSVIVPFGSNFPSPLETPTPRITMPYCDEIESATRDCDDYWNRLREFVLICQEAERRHPKPQQPSARALFLNGQTDATLPSMQSITFLSSRVRFDPSSPLTKDGLVDSPLEQGSTSMSGKQGLLADDDHDLNSSSEDGKYGPVTGKVVGGTAALVKGAFGMALGAVRWGLSGKGVVGDTSRGMDDDDDNASLDDFLEADDDSKNMMSTAQYTQQVDRRGRETDMVPWPMSCAAFAFCDAPRRFESAVVDPSGSLVATTDNLGRVILFDLDTNQPIRMFKGMRGVFCNFAEVPYNDDSRASARLYLVVHFLKRGVVEIYQLIQGPRVTSIVVPNQKDCAILNCFGPPSEGSRVSSFLLERTHGVDENQGVENHYIIDKLIIDDFNSSPNMPSQKPVQSVSQNESKMHLRLFMQLLAPDTNIKCTAQTVLATFRSIHTFADLGDALDALSKSTRLEREMGIDGSNLLSQAISHCRSRLKHAKDVDAQEGSGTVRKTAIEEMSSKLAYFDRLVHAYDVLNRYEIRNGLRNNDIDEDIGIKEKMSPWASEALYWISATSSINMLTIKGDTTFNTENDKPMEFSMFSMACQSYGNDKVYFTKVKRDRLPVITRIFRPLLQDLFVFKVVNSLMGSLGLDHDFDILQQYFGEWICSLPTEVVARSNLTGAWRPMVRWLHELILSAHGIVCQGQHTFDNDLLKRTAMLQTLLKFCMDMEDLPKAFLLAVICLDAVSSASIQLEQKTYGEISEREVVTPWEDLLRKLRVCLLVSVRLEGNVNRMGETNPMTVNNVSRNDLFSVYSWIALDELSLSQDNQVILALESACLSNPESFYPTTVDGDREHNRKAIIQSCSSPLHGRRLDDSRTQPLLFYLKDHAHFTTRLAANRALILASMWGQSPANMALLNNTILTLQTVVERAEGFSLATLVEIYQMHLRPVCRTLLFGFGEHEQRDDIFSRLIEDKTWLGQLISSAKQILSMMVECMQKISEQLANTPVSSEMWPPIRECPILNALVLKYPNIQLTSVELHHTVIFAFEMTQSISSLETAVPSLPNLFLAGSIFTSMPCMLKGSIGQQDLLDKAILNHAASSQRPVIDNFSCLTSVELFGKSLGVDCEYVRTRFLIEMIRLGKDASILDLLGTSISTSENKAYLLEAVVQIISVRLHSTILSLKQSKKYRGLLSLLDADATQWLREEATRCSLSQLAPASLIITNSLAIMVQRMFGNSSDESMSKKIGTLCLISEILLKAVQAQELESVMNL